MGLCLAADLRGLCSNRSFLLQDLHISGCDGLVAFPGGFKASTPPFCWSTHSFCSLELYFCYVWLTKCCSRVIFSFLVTYSARLIFQFCVADLIATRSLQPSLYHCWTKVILSKRKGIYFLKGYFLFPLRRQGNKTKKKKKKLLLLILVLNLLSTSSPLSFNLGICFCTQIQNSLFLFNIKYIYH